MFVVCCAPAVPVGAQPVPARAPGRRLLAAAIDAYRQAQYEQAAPAFHELLDRYDGEPRWEREALPRVRFLLACSLFNIDRHAEARDLFDRFLADCPADPCADEARFRRAEIEQFAGNVDEAIRRYDEILASDPAPTLADRVRYERAQCLFDAERMAEAVTALRPFVETGPADLVRKARGLLALALARTGAFPEAEEQALAAIRAAATLEEAVLLNAALLEVADRLDESGRTRAALRCYRQIRPPGELCAAQHEQVDALARSLELPPAHPGFDALWTRRILRRRLAASRDRLERLEASEPREALLYTRIARGFRRIGRARETIIAARAARARAGTNELARVASVEEALAWEQLGRPDDAAAVLMDAARSGPGTDPAVETATAAALLKAGRTTDALALLDGAADAPADSPLLSERLLLLGRAALVNGDTAGAERALARLRTDFPDEPEAAEATYWHGVVLAALGRYEEAAAALNTYVNDDPAPALAADARYRLALALRARGRIEDALTHIETLLAGGAPSAVEARARALTGDLRSGMRDFDGAVEAYRSVSADEREPRRYAVFQAVRILEARRRTEELVGLLETYLGEDPAPADAVDFHLRLARLAVEAGRTDDTARHLRSAFAIGGADPACESFDRGALMLAAAADRIGDGDRLAAALADDVPGTTPAADARRSYWTVRLRSGSMRDAAVRLLADHAGVDAGPFLLVAGGDALRETGDDVGARERYRATLDRYPDSVSAAAACAGLARCALDRNAPDEALEWLERHDPARLPPGDRAVVELVRADALLAADRVGEALTAYRRILSTRAWRGPTWPAALYGAGRCLETEGDPRKAFAYYQRIYVLYGSHDAWVARAYLASGRCLEELDRPDDALRTYRELVADPRLRGRPEYRLAEEKIRAGSPQG